MVLCAASRYSSFVAFPSYCWLAWLVKLVHPLGCTRRPFMTSFELSICQFFCGPRPQVPYHDTPIRSRPRNIMVGKLDCPRWCPLETILIYSTIGVYRHRNCMRWATRWQSPLLSLKLTMLKKTNPQAPGPTTLAMLRISPYYSYKSCGYSTRVTIYAKGISMAADMAVSGGPPVS